MVSKTLQQLETVVKILERKINGGIRVKAEVATVQCEEVIFMISIPLLKMTI
jgi:hypothetical protein